MKVFNDLKTRGVSDILIAVTDGLKGMPEALGAVRDFDIALPAGNRSRPLVAIRLEVEGLFARAALPARHLRGPLACDVGREHGKRHAEHKNGRDQGTS